MIALPRTDVPLRQRDQFFIAGTWVNPSSRAQFVVIDPTTEEPFFEVAEALAPDVSAAAAAARDAFDHGPWPCLSPAERTGYRHRMGDSLRARASDAAAMWPRESGALHSFASLSARGAAQRFHYYADLSGSFFRSRNRYPRPPAASSGSSRESRSVLWRRSSRGMRRSAS